MLKTKSFEIPKELVWNAFKLVKANKGAAGVDGQSLKDFESNLGNNLYRIWNRMSSGSYFPPPVKAVSIPKKSGGERILGVPTVSDRVAQMVVKLVFEPKVEPHFHEDSYGYRPGRSAHQAIAVTRKRCWWHDWVLEFDIKGLFDNIDHGLLMKAVRHHVDCKWVLLYIERWLTAPMQSQDGCLTERKKGTPQGGVVSPLLANLFLHYAFDRWMATHFPKLPFLFREIGSYDGRMCESLVLHQRAGYAKIYSIWQQLKLYLDFFGSDAFVSIRSVEQLYEIWCLLEVRRVLMELGFIEGKSPNRHLRTSGFEKKLKKADEMFHLHRPDGMKALLVHEPSYSGPKKSEFGKIYSWTTTQRPDIFLEITLPAGDKVRWVFDAKYRIDNNGNKKWPQTGIDTVPDDAINQMHRYRDSLIYISKAVEDGDRDKSRPIVGAFALYPGWFDQNRSENPYQDSVEAVGIGAFPLLPGQENRWLAEFLKSQIGEYSETSYEAKEVDELYLQESVRIAPHGMKQYRHSELILAADIFDSKGKAYVRPFEEGAAQWYHIPESTVQNYKISRHVMREMKFCAFSTNSDDGRICLYFYPVVSVVLKLRNEIDEYAGGASSRGGESFYWLIELGKSFQAPVTLAAKKKQRKFRFRLVAFHDFLKAESWDDIPRKYLKNV